MGSVLHRKGLLPLLFAPADNSVPIQSRKGTDIRPVFRPRPCKIAGEIPMEEIPIQVNFAEKCSLTSIPFSSSYENTATSTNVFSWSSEENNLSMIVRG